MQSTEHKSFHTPDETREFPNGHAAANRSDVIAIQLKGE